MLNIEKLDEKIKATGLQKGFIAKQLGLTPNGLALKLNGVNEFKASEVLQLCEVLGIKSLKEKESIFFDKKVD